MTTNPVEFKNSRGDKLSGIVRYSEPIEPVKYPVMIILHGFAEDKHHDLAADLANNLVHYGFLTLRFDFHGHGDSEGEFEEHTIQQQVDDVFAALDFVSTLPYADKDRISVFGTDIGGNIALLAAAKDARIRCVIAQGARSHFEHHLRSWFQPHEFSELMTKGVHDHVEFKIRKEYVRSTRMQDIIEELKKVYVPVLFVHGNADFRVPIEETRQLFLAANQPKAMEEVPDADHWFRGETARTQLMELAAEWARKWVR
jgi:dipeptidyl aminopeptidase/acylaminoacyl peptidase